MSGKRLYLIDATAFCYRAFYAVTGLSTSFGQPTNAIYGFVNMLNKILKADNPEFLAVCFDISRDTFRQKKFSEYKIQRPPMPEGLTGQIPLIKQIVSAYGIALLEKEGFEADDIIATLVHLARKKGMPVTIISSDKDILQLVSDDTAVFSPYKDEGTLYDKDKVLERFGTEPEQIPDIIALMGDSADNIPGAKGIGEKTAVNLIKDFGSVENLIKNKEKIEPERLRKIIDDNLKQITLSKELAILDKKVDIGFNLEQIKISPPNYQELFRLFKRLEFKSLLKNLPYQDGPLREVKSAGLKDAELESRFSENEELFLYAATADSLAVSLKGEIFLIGELGINAKSALANHRIKKVSHDLKKLKILLAGENIAFAGLFFDTMVAAYLINPSAGGYGLADAALEYLQERVADKITDSAQALDLIGRLRPKLEKELKDRSLFKLFTEIEMPLVEVLAEMEICGIKLDLKILAHLSRDLEKRLIKLIDDIYAASGTQFNINSPKQLRGILFEKLKLPVVKRSKTGPSTDEEVLRKLADKHKLPALLLEYRQLMKLKTTYIDVLPEMVDKKTGRIHTTFNQTATETGRLSSSSPNLQNVPIKTDIGSQIRRSIIAGDNKSYLLSCDYSQIELRILAHLAGEESLIFAFKEDKDIHKATASLIYNLREEEINDSMREAAKRVNFGIIYGLSAFGLARDLGISHTEAQQFIDAYFLRYPGVREYIENQIKQAKKEGFVTTILGRRRYIPEINNKNAAIRQFAERQAVNTPIQGSAADLIKLAMIRIHDYIKEKNLKVRMIMQIHDELVFEVPEKELKPSAAFIKDKMENVLKLNVPVRVSIKKGRNWLEMEDIG